MSSNFLVFHTSGCISSSSAAFLFLIFLSTESSSSWVNGPSLLTSRDWFMSNFFLLTSFIVCHAILDCLSSTESLILSIWFWCYSGCSFRYMLANSFRAFLSFSALILVGFFLLHLEAVFTSADFSLTANVSHGILDFILCLVGMNSAAAFKWALTKFSYSLFGVCVCVFSCRASYLFLSVIAYLSLISLLLRRAQS